MCIGLDLVVSVSAMTSSIGSYCIVENLFFNDISPDGIANTLTDGNKKGCVSHELSLP